MCCIQLKNLNLQLTVYGTWILLTVSHAVTWNMDVAHYFTCSYMEHGYCSLSDMLLYGIWILLTVWRADIWNMDVAHYFTYSHMEHGYP